MLAPGTARQDQQDKGLQAQKTLFHKRINKPFSRKSHQEAHKHKETPTQHETDLVSPIITPKRWKKQRFR
jgi:hypothetical protein